MGNPRAFLTIGRTPSPRRPIEERVGDYHDVYARLSEPELRAQASRCMDCGVPFCNTGCPLGNLIPEWNHLAYQGQWDAAIERLHATNNFPEFTGALCPAPCENACVLSINDKPVTIKEVERTIIERAFSDGRVIAEPPWTRSEYRVAVIGSGPAGLAAAQQLNRDGHHVTVFEKDDRIGGLLTYGIPDFKIEKSVVERRVQLLIEEGIEFHTNTHVGVSPTATELRAEYDAILLAVGALAGRDIDVPGRELNGIHLAMDYLVQQNRRVAGLSVDGSMITAAGKRVVIIGGGDTGADCLGNVHRERCASVEIFTRGPLPPMQPDPLEWPDVPFVLRTWPAHEEGGDRHFEIAITGFSGTNGHVQHVHCIDGENVARTVEADLVLLAIGFAGPVRDALFDQLQPEMHADGAISSDARFHTSVPGVFVAGDASRGASLVVWAIADGRRAAASISQWLELRRLKVH